MAIAKLLETPKAASGGLLPGQQIKNAQALVQHLKSGRQMHL